MNNFVIFTTENVTRVLIKNVSHAASSFFTRVTTMSGNGVHETHVAPGPGVPVVTSSD